MDFPHLTQATSFPINDNPPQPYAQYINKFDYLSWSPNTIVQLCSVPWDSVTNAVEFDTIQARTDYFNSLDSLSITLDVFTRIIKNTVKIPIPYDVSNIYNYVHVIFPTMPVEGENAQGVKEWGFFIENINYRSPSTTELTLSVDWFTWFVDKINIKNVQLQQGHWAIANSASVADFLANPLGNLENLTDNEMDNINSNISHPYLYEYYNNETQIAILNIRGVNPQGSFTDTIPFRDRINTNAETVRGVMIAVELGDLRAFLDSLNVGFYTNIKALWIAPKKYFKYSSAFTLNNVSVRYVRLSTAHTHSLKFRQTDFNFPDSVKDYTKLYTSQYSHVTAYRSDGTSFEIGINDITSNSKVKSVALVNDDRLQILQFVDGIESDCSSIYNITRLTDDNSFTYHGALNRFLATYDVPCYALYIDNDSLQDYRKQYDRAQARLNASTAQTNSNASASTAQTNANASADNAKTNADASADTAKTNTTRSTNNSVVNTNESVTTSTNNQTLSNELSEDTTNLAIAVANENNWKNIESQISKLGVQGLNRTNAETAQGSIHGDVPSGSQIDTALQNATLDQDYVNKQQTIMRDSQADGLATTGLSNMIQAATGIASIGNGMGTSILDVMTSPNASAVNQSGGALGGQVLSGGIAIASAAASVVSTVNNFNVTIAKEDAMQDATRIYQIGDGVAIGDGGKIGVQMQNTLYQNLQERKLARGIQTNSNQNARVNLNGGSLLDVTVRHGTLSTATSINTNNGNLQKTVASNNKTTTDTNATATQSTTKANATRTRDTSKANAKRSYDTSVANNTRTYNNSISAIENGIKTDNIQMNVQLTTDNGVNWSQTPIGAQYCVATPNTGDVLRIGERFNRYGYVCNRTIASPNLNVMTKWSYWKCSETTILPNGSAPQQAVNYISTALRNGITVWSNPNQIGDVEGNEPKK